MAKSRTMVQSKITQVCILTFWFLPQCLKSSLHNVEQCLLALRTDQIFPTHNLSLLSRICPIILNRKTPCCKQISQCLSFGSLAKCRPLEDPLYHINRPYFAGSGSIKDIHCNICFQLGNFSSSSDIQCVLLYRSVTSTCQKLEGQVYM